MRRLALTVFLLVGCQTSVTVPEQSAGDVGADLATTRGVDSNGPSTPGEADAGSADAASADGLETTEGDTLKASDSLSLDAAVPPDQQGDIGEAKDASAGDATETSVAPPDASSDACAPQCDGKQCGDDGCGGSCGPCPTLWSCQDGLCVEEECVPLCGGLDCGFDGCGGVCGFCEPGEACEEGLCELVCTCEDKECGDDGCGNDCGGCDPAYTCINNTCDIAEGSWSCTEILGCQDQCGPDETLCKDACVLSGDMTGQYEYQLYATCLDNHECTDALCIAEHCASETAICEYDESGSLSCAEVVDCQNDCLASDQACIDACIPLGDIASQAEYISLVYCIQFFCPPGSIPNCVNFALSDATLCADYYQACLE